MVEWSIALMLILAGLSLVVLEIFFVHGTTVVGLIVFVLQVPGVIFAFNYYGSTIGWSVAGGTALVTAVVLYFSFRSNVWSRFSLKTTLDGRVNEGELDAVTAGAEGVALSALRPSGKAELNKKTFEVRTLGPYVESGSKIRVVQIESNKIIVEPLV